MRVQVELRAAGLGIVLMALGLALPSVCMAQAGMDADGPPPAFAGGQMVRGTVTAVAADRLTVKTEQGDVYQVVTTANTRVRKGRDPMKLADVHAGDGVGAMGVLDPATKTVHAMAIGVMDAEQIRKAREAMGKTWIAGKVTAIDLDNLKITVLREDNVSQVIGLDDDTSFKRGGRAMNMMAGDPMGGMGGGGNRGGGQGRPGPAGQGAQGGGGGESITLADVKVGDVIGGPGALKGGVFVPTELRVANPPAAGGARRRRPDGAAGTNGGTNAAGPQG